MERLCTATRNCSQKERQFRMFPSKVGTSSFGSFPPLLSEVTREEPVERGLEDESFFLILTEESKTSFSRVAN